MPPLADSRADVDNGDSQQRVAAKWPDVVRCALQGQAGASPPGATAQEPASFKEKVSENPEFLPFGWSGGALPSPLSNDRRPICYTWKCSHRLARWRESIATASREGRRWRAGMQRRMKEYVPPCLVIAPREATTGEGGSSLSQPQVPVPVPPCKQTDGFPSSRYSRRVNCMGTVPRRIFPARPTRPSSVAVADDSLFEMRMRRTARASRAKWKPFKYVLRYDRYGVTCRYSTQDEGLRNRVPRNPARPRPRSRTRSARYLARAACAASRVEDGRRDSLRVEWKRRLTGLATGSGTSWTSLFFPCALAAARPCRPANPPRMGPRAGADWPRRRRLTRKPPSAASERRTDDARSHTDTRRPPTPGPSACGLTGSPLGRAAGLQVGHTPSTHAHTPREHGRRCVPPPPPPPARSLRLRLARCPVPSPARPSSSVPPCPGRPAVAWRERCVCECPSVSTQRTHSLAPSPANPLPPPPPRGAPSICCCCCRDPFPPSPPQPIHSIPFTHIPSILVPGSVANGAASARFHPSTTAAILPATLCRPRRIRFGDRRRRQP